METNARRQKFFQTVLRRLTDASVPFLVGGGYALARYTGVERLAKDLDLFVRHSDCRRALEVLRASGYRCELAYSHWLAKVYEDDWYVDIIFSSGNGVATVDDGWFEHAIETRILGQGCRICPVEETIWSKSFIMERERYDGADVAHLLRSCGASLDWDRLLDRFGEHKPVLLSHIILFRYIYPDRAEAVPSWLVERLLEDWRRLSSVAAPAGVCRGTLLSREQFLTDIEDWGYQDARLSPHGYMTDEEVEQWTAAAGDRRQ